MPHDMLPLCTKCWATMPHPWTGTDLSAAKDGYCIRCGRYDRCVRVRMYVSEEGTVQIPNYYRR